MTIDLDLFDPLGHVDLANAISANMNRDAAKQGTHSSDWHEMDNLFAEILLQLDDEDLELVQTPNR